MLALGFVIGVAETSEESFWDFFSREVSRFLHVFSNCCGVPKKLGFPASSAKTLYYNRQSNLGYLGALVQVL